jgi:hypothetical protein
MVLYALCDVFCVFLLHRESPDMILGDKPLRLQILGDEKKTQERLLEST